jgi:hypothetical protein
MNIDEEWENFISHKPSNDIAFDNDDIDEIITDSSEEFISADISLDLEVPKATDIYISTKTKIAYLNTPIDLKTVFWNIPTINYFEPKNGVIKKQMKFNTTEIEELNLIKSKLVLENYYEEHIITHIDNPTGRIKFKDIRKISIGISKKDIISFRCKKKSAFYNCFVIILRLKVNEIFKEFHVKVFNTGKLEIPGIQNETSFQQILTLVIETLQPHMENPLHFVENSDETVLINSNFNCGYFIDREVLNHILKHKYNIQCIYDPCSYPGIQCKFYYTDDEKITNSTNEIQPETDKPKNIREVSFMIFRTGSVLIVGKCGETMLLKIYEFLKDIFINEYMAIRQNNLVTNEVTKVKQKKIRKKNITITTLA